MTAAQFLRPPLSRLFLLAAGVGVISVQCITVHGIGVVPLHRRQLFFCRCGRRQHNCSSSRAVAHNRPANSHQFTGTCADRRLAPRSGQSLMTWPDHRIVRGAPGQNEGHRRAVHVVLALHRMLTALPISISSDTTSTPWSDSESLRTADYLAV
jgi:hypothetical protein